LHVDARADSFCAVLSVRRIFEIFKEDVAPSPDRARVPAVDS
jgi:hypothetical protein